MWHLPHCHLWHAWPTAACGGINVIQLHAELLIVSHVSCGNKMHCGSAIKVEKLKDKQKENGKQKVMHSGYAMQNYVQFYAFKTNRQTCCKKEADV